tara:strand:+ start:963 stop:2360 length:1398 start_codon:yes stop_codon:yes gene_type:complete
VTLGRICLIIDNPLRDIDGICLIAWHLSQIGHEVFITPMYDQVYDVFALKPDLVLSNYARANNFELLKQFYNLGIKVIILDTEGVGDWWEKHSKHMSSAKIDDFVEKYLCWGKGQAATMEVYGGLKSGKVVATGCPRYDFISRQWRSMLDKNQLPEGYILVNTNFPVVNPQFSTDTKAETKTWAKALEWMSVSQAQNFAKHSQNAFEKMLVVITELAEAFPESTIVVRPHPFEEMTPYKNLSDRYSNVRVRKEGTSLVWINKAAVLLHMNCFTAVEASFMNVEAISLEWINSKVLREHSPEPYLISHKAESFSQLKDWITLIFDGGKLEKSHAQNSFAADLIPKSYLMLDGNSGARVAKTLSDLIDLESKAAQKVPVAFRNRVILSARQLLGHRLSELIRWCIMSQKNRKNRKLKQLDIGKITQFFNNITVKNSSFRPVRVEFVDQKTCDNSRLLSGKSIKISCS